MLLVGSCIVANTFYILRYIVFVFKTPRSPKIFDNRSHRLHRSIDHRDFLLELRSNSIAIASTKVNGNDIFARPISLTIPRTCTSPSITTIVITRELLFVLLHSDWSTVRDASRSQTESSSGCVFWRILLCSRHITGVSGRQPAAEIRGARAVCRRSVDAGTIIPSVISAWQGVFSVSAVRAWNSRPNAITEQDPLLTTDTPAGGSHLIRHHHHHTYSFIKQQTERCYTAQREEKSVNSVNES